MLNGCTAWKIDDFIDLFTSDWECLRKGKSYSPQYFPVWELRMVTKVTSTGLTEDERDLAVRALSVVYPGTEYSGDLSHEVSVLIVNPSSVEKTWIRSAKFQYVVSFRPDVNVVSLECVLELVEKVQRNPKMKIRTIMDLPSIKPFTGLKISICRLEDEVGDKITSLVQKNGGTVSTSLATDTDLMISMFSEGRRYETALEWKIPVVSPDWCYDSVERGLFLNPKYYILTDSFTGYVKKVDFDCDEDKIEKTVKIYKMGNREDACDWEKLKEWHAQKAKFKLEERVRLVLQDGIDKDEKTSFKDLSVDLKRNRKVRRQINDSKGESDDDDDEERVVKMKRFHKDKSKMRMHTWAKSEPIQRSLVVATMPDIDNTQSPTNGPLLKGMNFYVVGFEQTERNKLQKVLSKFGGTTTQTAPATYTIVNFKYNTKVEEPNCITDLAVERFLYLNSVKLDKRPWFKPFTLNTQKDIPSFRKSFMGTAIRPGRISVCFTGFKGSDVLHLERLVKERFHMWFEHRENFSRDVELLVFNAEKQRVSPTSHTGRKLELARKWQIKCLDAEHFFSQVVRS